MSAAGRLSSLWRAVDDGVESLLHRLSRRGRPADPIANRLAPHRRRTAIAIARACRPRVDELSDAVVRRAPDALARYDALAAEALAEMRRTRPPGPLALLAWMDRLVLQEGEEYLDDPSFPRDARVRTLDVLDRFNTHAGGYAQWITLLADLLAVAETLGHRPVNVYDLAAGHGGFAVFLKERLGARIRVTATDLVPEYLELGREQAARRGVDVRFAVQDATDLRNLRRADVDLFVCTQSLHHFTPGMVARMIGEAARCAQVGVCFVDGERGFLPIAVAAPLFAAYGRSWPIVHDAVVSLRRMFREEELLLLAEIAPALPRAARIESGRCGPGHAYVRVSLA